MSAQRRTIESSDRPGLLAGMRAKNNGRYNGSGRHGKRRPKIFEPLDREFNLPRPLRDCGNRKVRDVLR